MRRRRVRAASVKRKRLARVLRERMEAAGGVGVGDGVVAAGLRVSRRLGRRVRASRRSLRWRLRRWKSAHRERLRNGLRRCGSRASCARRLVRVKAGGSVVDANAADGSVVDASVVDATRDWMRCGSGLRREVRGRRRAMMR